jgi:hypothetical protein
MLDYVAATSHGFDPTLGLYAAYSYANGVGMRK